MNGVTVEYRQDGRGPALLLLHSLLTEMSVFDRVLQPLTRTHRVTCLNLPGFGASDPVELNSVGEHADHVARVMDALSLQPTVDLGAVWTDPSLPWIKEVYQIVGDVTGEDAGSEPRTAPYFTDASALTPASGNPPTISLASRRSQVHSGTRNRSARAT